MEHKSIIHTTAKWFIIGVILSLFVFTAACIFSMPSVNNSPSQYPNLTNKTPRFTAIASYGATGLALRNDGRVVCWGLNNGYGQNGLCDIPRNLTDAVAIFPMYYAVKKDGTAVGWGNPKVNMAAPSNLTGITSITRARYCYIALKDDGTLTFWHCGNDTQKAIIANQSDLISISENLGLKKDGTVVTWNIKEYLQSSFIHNLSDVIAVSNRWENYAILKKDGTVVAWRVPTVDEVDEGKVFPITIVENLTGIAAISAGDDHTLALKRDGSVISWTNDSLRSLDLMDIAAVSAGAQTDFALKNDGSIVAWGDNEFGQLFIPENSNNIKSISSGAGPNIILKNDGTIVTWGYFEYMDGHEPEGVRNVTGILADDQRYLILMNNDTIYGGGNPGTYPFKVSQIPHPFLTLLGNKNALFALNKDGKLVILSHSLLASGRLDNVTEISSNGGSCILTVRSDGTISAWNYDGVERMDVPKNLSEVVTVSAGQQHYLALKTDGKVVAWGGNVMGQTNVPDGLSDVTAISAGMFHSLALKKDGTVVCWGGNKYGECNVPEDLHNIVAISAGEGQSLALTKDRNVVAWGKTVIPDWYG